MNVDSGIKCLSFHPDGLILGTGAQDCVVQIWDIKQQKKVGSLQGHNGPVVDLSFSGNGYYLATAQNNSIKMWDLRKSTNLLTIDLEDFNLSAIEFDDSGTYLAAAGQDLRIYAGKTLNHINTFTKHTSAVTDVKFGKDAQWLASTSLDRSLKIWGKKGKN